MNKQVLPLLIGLCIGGVAMAQTTTSQTTQTTASAATPADSITTTTTTTKTWGTVPPSGALSEDAIKGDIAQAGYKEVKGLEFKDGVWQAKARGGNKKW